jgi:hypothetical protein
LFELDLQQPPQGTNAFWERALANLNKARDRVARRYNLERREAQFRVVDLVLVKLRLKIFKTLQRSDKIAKKWSDPLVIFKYLTPGTVQIANQETGVVVGKAHVSQLKKYFPNA